MRVLVIGGTGRCGKIVIDELLNNGHQVIALARNPSSLGDARPGLTVIQGTPTELSDVREAFQPTPPDAVIVTLSAPRASDSPFAAPISPPRLLTDCNTNVITAMKEFGVRKIVVLQAFGVGESWDNMSCVLRLLMSKSNMSYQYDDHNATEKVVKESGLDYVFVWPSRLVESDQRDVKVWPNNGKGVPLMATTSRVGVAQFLVEAVESEKWNQSAVITTSNQGSA